VDPTGEQPLTGMVVSVDKVSLFNYVSDFHIYITAQSDEGLVTCLDESRHGLEDGDFVTFTEVQGMTQLNNCNPRKVTVKGPYTFTICNTSDLGEYIRGGIFTQVKMPKILEFVSYTHVSSD
jgi:ubiquitin-activating enzyme E1